MELTPVQSSSGRRSSKRELAAPRAAGRPARQLRARDIEILAWLARHRFATASQVSERFDIGPNRTARRLGQLAGAGYLIRAEPFRCPSVYLVTRAGLTKAESNLPPARFDVRTYRHDLGVTALAVELELAGAQTVSEREMRAREAACEGQFAARFTPDPTARMPRRHFADLAIERANGTLEAFELELTPKRTRRLTAILKAYRRSPHITAVVYYVERPELARRIEELARVLHLDDRLSVRWW
jgi:hypothetical protein